MNRNIMNQYNILKNNEENDFFLKKARRNNK